MKRNVLVGMFIAVLVLGAVALTGCGSGGSSSSGTAGTTPPATTAGGTAVTIQNFAFSPASVNVKVGDSVTWTNKDSATHQLAGDGGIASDPLATGAAYTQKFDTAGSFNYHCSIHPSMTGTVVVK
jgi:plastocyanin